MKNNKILSAEEFRIKECVSIEQDLFNSDLHELMINFAKYHVHLALIAASESYFCEGDIHECTPLPENILNSYPESNIK